MFSLWASPPNDSFIGRAVAWTTAICISVGLSTSASLAWAQGAATAPGLVPSSNGSSNLRHPAPKPAVRKSSSEPSWENLTPAQQRSLKPLAANWNSLKESQKRKWMAIAANYPVLAPADQIKLHGRMTEWVSLSARQRTQARLNFAQSKKLAPAQKQATWQAYQALSPAEKQNLALSATPKPTGAAIVVKPVSPKKLATVPVTRRTSKRTAEVAATSRAMNRRTLLPATAQPMLGPKSAIDNAAVTDSPE